MFLSTISQAMGPEMMIKFINPEEAIKRLAASQGIDTLKLVKTEAERNAEMSQMMSQNAQTSLMGQAGALAKAPLLDPSKNPEALDSLRNASAAFSQTAQPTQAPA
jgi:predicted phage-related endonuclease